MALLDVKYQGLVIIRLYKILYDWLALAYYL